MGLNHKDNLEGANAVDKFAMRLESTQEQQKMRIDQLQCLSTLREITKNDPSSSHAEISKMIDHKEKEASQEVVHPMISTTENAAIETEMTMTLSKKSNNPSMATSDASSSSTVTASSKGTRLMILTNGTQTTCMGGSSDCDKQIN